MTTAAAVAVKSNGTTPHPPPAASPPKFVASQLLDLKLIEADPNNPRKDFPKEEMNELINSVMLHGVREPIEVRPVGPDGAKPKDGVVGLRYRIVFGERRYRAAKAAGHTAIPAMVRQATDLEACDVQLDENLKRADLSPLEIAGGYQRLLDLGRTMEQVCERAGRKRTQVYGAIALLKLGDEARKAIGEGLLDAETAKLLVKYVPKSLQAEQVKVLVGPGKDQWGKPLEPMTYREARAHLTGFVVELKDAPWQLKDEKVAAGPGCGVSCAVCPKRAGNNPDLYTDVKPDVCTDRVAYAGKLHLFRQAELAKTGAKLLTPKEAPVAEVFWDHSNVVRPDSGFVEPGDICDKDAKRRPVGELLTPEQLKKLTVMALDHRGQPRQLLPRAGLEKELKKAGRLTTFEEAQKKREAAVKKKADAPAKGPRLEELTRDVLMGRCVAAVEDKGLLTTPLLKLIACKLLDAMTFDQRLSARRGLKASQTLFKLDAKGLDKAFPKLTPGKLAGLVFEAVFDDAFEVVGDVDELDTPVQDVCELLGVDPAKVAAELAAEQAAKVTFKPGPVEAVKKAAKALGVQYRTVKAKKARPVKKAAKNGGKKR